MSTHGITIGLERIDEDVFLSIKAVGKLTHADYERLVPMLDAALEKVKEPKVRVLFDASEFHGWEMRAAWDDLKLGFSHGADFERIALYGPHSWQEWAAKVSNWFLSGEVKSFHDHDDAINWLLS